MSDQTPWGTTPPASGDGQPPYGAPAPNPYQSPSGPPAKSNTALIVGLVVAGVVVLALVLGGVLLAVGSGSDDDEPEAATGASTSATPSDGESDAPSDETADENAVRGTGYSYDLPGKGWTDASDDAAQLGPTIDSISILGSSFDTAQSNILIETGPSGSAELTDLQPAWERNISGPDKATTQSIADITIADEPAVGVSVERTNGAGVPITQVAYLTVHDGNQFSIALSFPSEGDEVSQDDFETALASWSWAS